MKEKTIPVTLTEAKEWYTSGNATLKKIALKVFNEAELKDFRNIKSFKDACEVLDLNYSVMNDLSNSIYAVSIASAAMFKLNIIKKALNLYQYLHLTRAPKDSLNIYYPCNPIISTDSTYSTYFKNKLYTNEVEVIGKIKSEGIIYKVLGGIAFPKDGTGLSGFKYYHNAGNAYTDAAFLGCGTKEIAKHFGKYFGMLITQAKFGDLEDVAIITSKYY